MLNVAHFIGVKINCVKMGQFFKGIIGTWPVHSQIIRK